MENLNGTRNQESKNPIIIDWKEINSSFTNVSVIQGSNFLYAIVNKEHNLLYIENFSIEPDQQKMGIGSNLLKNLISEAQGHGIHTITANIRSLGGLKVLRKAMPKMKAYKAPGSFLDKRDPNTELRIEDIISNSGQELNIDIVAEI